MTKAELIKELEGLNDDAIIYVQAETDWHTYNIKYTCDRVDGTELQNEITLYCE